MDQVINLACSGAESSNIWRLSHGGQSLEGERPQADALAEVARSHRVQMVVLSVGGNDVGFGDILQACMTGYLTGSGSCRTAQQAQVQARFATAMAAVDRSVKEIRAAMADAAHPPSAAWSAAGGAQGIPASQRLRTDRAWPLPGPHLERRRRHVEVPQHSWPRP
ncbi:hypothetical protein [Streptomyces sp. NPDC048248]|uniref:hypothetical protein n=1 Tax=Streptomyces sp. NPDC048248 TaxID=3365523 RepID=UPI00371027E6